jgi:type VI secretion system protein ImpJ
MGQYDKVVWSEGLFLCPQHFQQQERYFEGFSHRRAAVSGPFFWGFHRLELDTDAFSFGRVALKSASGILQDGTPFDMPGAGRLPEPLNADRAQAGELIYLAVPLRNESTAETCFEEDDSSLARFRSIEQVLPDSNAIGLEPKTVQLAELRFRLLSHQDMSGSWIGLPVTRISEIRSDGSVVPDPGWIAPVNVCVASDLLQRWIDEIRALVDLRGGSLAQRLLAAGPRGADSGEMIDYLTLQTLNRHTPILDHIARGMSATPETLFLSWMALAAELSTFVRLETRRPLEHGPFRHGDPGACFRPLVEDLRYLLSVVVERGARRIALREQPHGIRLAVLEPTEFECYATFVLAVSAQMPSETLQQQIPARAKVGPPGKLNDLIASHLPGIPLLHVAVPPREIPYRAGFVYFLLAPMDGLWDSVRQYGGLAIHVAGSFPGFEIELWGVKRQ